MKIIVTGGRLYNNKANLFKTLDTFKPTMIIQGGADGADLLAVSYAKEKRIPCKTYKAEWELHGLSAGPKRNKLMLTENKDATVVAFKGGKGTKNCVETAKKLGIPVYEVVE